MIIIFPHGNPRCYHALRMRAVHVKGLGLTTLRVSHWEIIIFPQGTCANTTYDVSTLTRRVRTFFPTQNGYRDTY